MQYLLAFLCAQDLDRPQLVDLEYRYVTGYRHHYDRHALASVTMGISDLLHAGLQDSGDDVALLRILKYGVAAYLDAVLDVVNHEYGHASSYSMIGNIHPTMLRHKMYDPMPADPFSLVIRAMGINQISVGISSDDSLRIQALYAGNPAALAGYEAAAAAGGINQDQVLATRYADRYLNGRLSSLDCLPLIWETFSSLRTGIRGSGDLENYAAALRNIGVDSSPSLVMGLSMVRLLSGSVIQAAAGLLGGAFSSSREGYVALLDADLGAEWRVAWPEFESYLTRNGPTVKVKVPFGTVGVELSPSLERSFGRGELEGGLVVSLYKGFFRINAAAFVSGTGGNWIETAMSFSLFPWLSIYVGFQHGSGYTFRREIFGANDDGLHGSEASPFFGIELRHTFN
jgi:hypothetical protein